jgi:hypothetical protein
MADDVDVGRLQELERRLAALEGQTVQVPQGSQTQGGRVMDAGQQAQTGQQGALLQAFLQGQMVGQALAQAASQAAQAAQQGGQQQGGQQQGGAAPQFLSIFGCDGGGGWSPTNYDSIFWCRSRFMCNPQSLSCLC